MVPCNGTDCYHGFETVVNPQAGEITGTYRGFMEAMSFIIFGVGVVLNTGILTVFISSYPNIDTFDAYLMNLTFGELLASFGLSFMFFVEFTTSIAAVGDSGCRFLTWLDLTSVTITITTLVALSYNLYKSIYHTRQRQLKRHQLWGNIILLWLISSIPGMPYMATAKMGQGYCQIGSWSADAEILFICAMVFFQVIIPLALLVFLFVRTLLALRISIDRAVLNDETTSPGSEETYQRSVMTRKFRMVTSMSFLFYLLLITVSFIELALALDVSGIKRNRVKYARIRELASLLLCMKTAIIPMCILCFYDKLRQRIRKVCACNRDPEAYNTLRYDVYQQTVSEGGQTHEDEDQLERANQELGETDRDDVAILNDSM